VPIIAKRKKGDYSTPPEGLHSAVCVDVVDLGLCDTPWGRSPQVEIRWQLEDTDPKSEKGYPYMVRRRFTPSLSKKSNLLAVLESWRGRKFTPEELEGFDLERLIGVNCQVQILHNIKSENEVYANVQAVVPTSKLAAKLPVRGDYVRVCDRDKQAQNDEYHAEEEDIPF
jgi:hypothetical protein